MNEVVLYTQKNFKWEKSECQIVRVPETPTFMFTNYSLEENKNATNYHSGCSGESYFLYFILGMF